MQSYSQMQQMHSNAAMFRGSHSLDAKSMSTGCVRVEGKQYYYYTQ